MDERSAQSQHLHMHPYKVQCSSLCRLYCPTCLHPGSHHTPLVESLLLNLNIVLVGVHFCFITTTLFFMQDLRGLLPPELHWLLEATATKSWKIHVSLLVWGKLLPPQPPLPVGFLKAPCASSLLSLYAPTRPSHSKALPLPSLLCG